MSRLQQLKRLAINDEGFIFDPQSGTSFVVNDTAKDILNGLKGEADEEVIINALTEHYHVSTEQAAQDVAEFMEKLKLYKLVD